MKNALTLTIAAALLFGSSLGCKTDVLSKLSERKANCATELPALYSADEYAARGGGEITEGKYECALADCQKALELDTKNVGALVCRGYARLKRGDFTLAESDFDEAVGLEPDNPITLYQRSHFYRETKQFGKALTDINRSIELMPADYQYEYRAKIHTDLTDFELALKDYSEAIRQRPEKTYYYSERAEVYRQLGKMDLAAADEHKYEELRAAEDAAEQEEREADKTPQEKINERILNEDAISLPKPIYPPAARAVKASGEVRVQISVDGAGIVVSAKAISGNPFLRASAEQAARATRFKSSAAEGILIFNFIAR